MYTEALNTLEEQRPYQKQQLEQQFIDPTTGLTPEGRKIQDINSLYNEAFGRNVGLEGVSTYLPLMQQGMTKNELRRVLYDSDEGKALGKSSLGAPIEIGVGGGLLGGAPYVAPALPSGSSGALNVVPNTQPIINQPAITQPVINQTVDQIAAGQQTIGDTLTDTDMSTATPSTFDLYGSQIDQLMPIYQQELGRSIQDPAALAFYGDMLKNGVSPDEIRRQIAGSSEGQGFVTPAEQAAINAQNLGFGASSVTGNAADDAAQLDTYNQFISDNNIVRGPGGEFTLEDYDNDLMNVFKGAQEYRQGFVNDLSGLLGSLTGQSTLNTNIPVTDLRPPVNANSNVADQFVNFDTLDQRIKDYENKFVSPY
jgi:hypothetical protein